jgi:type VI secretion system secreted protein VgrG
MSITLKAGGGFIVVGPAGVTISGTPVLINSGGSAGSGSGCSPDAPKAPREADKAEAGKVSGVQARTPPPAQTEAPRQEVKAMANPQAQTLVAAAQNGTPFCEK